MARTDFHRLTVTAVEPLTDDAAAVTFEVPARLRDTFVFRPGQSLTVRRGSEHHSYSICAAADRAPRIGIREVAGGAVSGWLVRQVRPAAVRCRNGPPRSAVSPPLPADRKSVV